MAAQIEEPVLHANVRNSKHRLPYFLELPFGFIPRLEAFLFGRCAQCFRRGERFAVDLAIGVQRQLRNRHKERGHHVFGQF